MIKLSYKELNNGTLTMALRKLATTPGLPISVAYRIGKMTQKIDRELNLGRDLFKRTLEAYALPGDQGQYQFDGEGNPKLKEGKTIEEWKAKETEFMGNEIELPYDQIPVDELGQAQLTATEIMALEPFLSGLEETESPSSKDRVSKLRGV